MMKKNLFWLLLIISLVIAYRIGNILIYDFRRLTDYGMVYLIGLILLFLVFIGLTFFVGVKAFRKNNLP